MNLRIAKESDAANIAAIGMRVWIDTYATTGVFDKISKYIFTEFSEEKIEKIIIQHSVVVSLEGLNIVGYMVLDDSAPDKTEIETLYVLPRFQNQGVGDQFIKRARELTKKPLWLSVWDQNFKAIRFYRKCGFKLNGELYFDLYGENIRNLVLESRP